MSKSKKLYEKQCYSCGKIFRTDVPDAKRCADCIKNPKEAETVKPKKKPKDTHASIYKVMAMLAEYNEKHGTSLTYGQYVSKFL